MKFAIIPPIAALFYGIGMLMPHTEPNFTIGIRTPWTISSATVWKKTHKLGGVLFRICGVVTFVGLLFPSQYVIWFLLAPIIVTAVWLTLYSYVIYEKKGKG
jgi:uncharacterized membrane protein